jgi:hypothetical protein
LKNKTKENNFLIHHLYKLPTIIFMHITGKQCNVKSGNEYLQWHIWIKCEDRKPLSPEQELFSLCINTVVKHSALGWKLYGFEFINPPLGKLHTVVDGLYKQKYRDNSAGCTRMLLPIQVKEGYFCDGTSWNAVLEVLSQNDASRNSVPEPFFLALV